MNPAHQLYIGGVPGEQWAFPEVPEFRRRQKSPAMLPQLVASLLLVVRPGAASRVLAPSKVNSGLASFLGVPGEAVPVACLKSPMKALSSWKYLQDLQGPSGS